MPLCILELGGKKKRNLDSQLCWFVTRRLPLVGLQIVLPELPWFNPFPSLPYCRYPESSTEEEQRNVRTIRGSNQHLGGLDEELALRRKPERSCKTAVVRCEFHREHLVGAAPSLSSLALAQGQGAMLLCLGKTNAAMAFPARAPGNKAE